MDGTSSVEDFSLVAETGSEDKAPVSGSKVLPDFFDPAVVKLVFSNPATEQKLRQFADSRHGAADMEFLLKVAPPSPPTEYIYLTTDPADADRRWTSTLVPLVT